MDSNQLLRSMVSGWFIGEDDPIPLRRDHEEVGQSGALGEFSTTSITSIEYLAGEADVSELLQDL